MAKTIEIEVKVDNSDAVSSTEKLNEGLEATGKTAEKSIGGVKKLGSSFGALTKSLGVIGLIVTAFEVLKEALGKNQKVMDAVNVATTAIGIVFNDLFNFISDNFTPAIEAISSAFSDIPATLVKVKDAIVNNIEVRFNALIDTFGLLGDAIKKVFSGDFSGALDSAGDAAKKFVDVQTGVENTVDRITEGVGDLVDATLDYTDSLIENSKAIISNKQAGELLELQQTRIREASDRDAENQRQIRDDYTKTFEERIAANKKLGDILEAQEIAEKTSVQKRIAALQAEQNQLGFSFERRKEIFALNTELIAIEAQQAGFKSEQKINEINLEKEQAEAKKAEVEAAKAKQIEDDKTEKDRKDKIAKDQEKTDKEEIANEKTKQAALQSIREAGIDNVENGIKLIASFGEKNKGLQAAALIAENATSIAKTVINTSAANIASIAKYALVPGGQALSAAEIVQQRVAAGISIATSIAATAKGLSALKKGGSAGSKPSLGGGGGSAPASTNGLSEDFINNGDFQAPDTETIGGGAGINQQPVQAIVLESDITNTQNRINNYQERSEIG